MIALGLARALGLRGTIILACLLVLFVTAYGVAQDLGLIEAPAKAAPAPKPAAGQPAPEPGRGRRHPGRLLAAVPAGRRPLPDALAGAGRDRQGRVRPRPGPTARGALGQQLGRGLWAHADRLCARAARPATPGPATATAAPTTQPTRIPAAARYLVDHGARRNLDRAIFAYNHSRSYVARVKQLARRYSRGGGRR